MFDVMDPDPRNRIEGAKHRIQQIEELLRAETNPKRCIALKAERTKCKKLIVHDVEHVKRFYSNIEAA